VHIQGNLLMLTWVGELLPEHVDDIHACLERMQKGHDTLFLLVDATGGTRLGPEARRRAASWHLVHHVKAVSIFGASTTVRAMAYIATALLKIFSPRSAIAVQFHRTEQAARAWLDVRRSDASCGTNPTQA